MTFGELLTSARTWLRDMEGVADADHLLTSAMALMYFNEAIDEACRRSRLIVDSTTAEICRIAITANTPDYDLDPRIIKVQRVMIQGRDTPLMRKSWRDLDEQFPGWEAQTGTVDSYLTDQNSGKLRLFRIPTVTNTASLTVVRTPLAPLTGLTSVPEIAPRYHAKLVQYVIGSFFDNEDSETYDPRKAARAMSKFDAEFGAPRPAQCESFEEGQPDYEGEW